MVVKYLTDLAAALSLMDAERAQLESALDVLDHARGAGHSVFVAGNGGSAAIADHAVVDLQKFARIPAISLVSHMAVITAAGNDYGYHTIFTAQLKMLASAGDVLIAISTSGESRNIVEAVSLAKEMDMRVIGITGNDGGHLAQLAHVCIHAPTANQQRQEDIAQAVVHALTLALMQRDLERDARRVGLAAKVRP
jgi:D-sedoheptulose 7-phosphate isomerase